MSFQAVHHIIGYRIKLGGQSGLLPRPGGQFGGNNKQLLLDLEYYLRNVVTGDQVTSNTQGGDRLIDCSVGLAAEVCLGNSLTEEE